MSEYPWDMENMVLAQHDQPCDCAICDEIHFNRETRRQRRKGQLEEVEKLKISLKIAEKQRDDRWIKVGLMSEQMRNDLLYAENEKLRAKIQAQDAKCNIYKCMDRKDLKLRIEQLESMHKEIVKECINIIEDYDREGDAEATLCGYVFASSVICAIKRKFGVEI